MAIRDIIECSATPELAAHRLSTALLRRELNDTQKAISETFAFAVTWAEGSLPEGWVQCYQEVWQEFDALVEQIRVGER